jgi:3-methyladenine DNA glycosylase AlkD
VAAPAVEVKDDEPVPTDLFARVDAVLREQADAERAAKQQAYMKSAMPYYGLMSPVFKAALRPILADYTPVTRDEWLRDVERLWGRATHREHWYAALAVARHRGAKQWVDGEAMPVWERLIREGAWWDVVDEIATHLVRDTVLKSTESEHQRMRQWATTEGLWLRRTAIICQVGAKERVDQGLLRDVIEPNIDDPDFFIRKAIGWALRDHARNDPEWVRRFVEEHPGLSGLSRREALKHG